MAFRIVKINSRCKLETRLNYLVCMKDQETKILLDEIDKATQTYRNASDDRKLTRYQNAINNLNSHHITVISVCSDSATANQAAFNKKHNYAVQYKIGEGLIRVPCLCHATDNSIKDVFEREDYYKTIVSTVQQILEVPVPWRKTTVHFSETRWNSLYLCVQFIVQNQYFYTRCPDTATKYQFIDEIR